MHILYLPVLKMKVFALAGRQAASVNNLEVMVVLE